jgi:hypothetical protein
METRNEVVISHTLYRKIAISYLVKKGDSLQLKAELPVFQGVLHRSEGPELTS